MLLLLLLLLLFSCVFFQGSEVLSQDGTLSIPEVSYDEAGHYMCVGAVPSVPGLIAQASVNLTIKGKGCQKMSTCTLGPIDPRPKCYWK